MTFSGTGFSRIAFRRRHSSIGTAKKELSNSNSASHFSARLFSESKVLRPRFVLSTMTNWYPSRNALRIISARIFPNNWEAFGSPGVKVLPCNIRLSSSLLIRKAVPSSAKARSSFAWVDLPEAGSPWSTNSFFIIPAYEVMRRKSSPIANLRAWKLWPPGSRHEFCFSNTCSTWWGICKEIAKNYTHWSNL